MSLSLTSVVCPGCAEKLPKRNRGCTHCGYEDPDRGKILPIGELAKLTSFPEKGGARFNDVSPKFIAAVIEASQKDAARLHQAIMG